MIGIAWALLTSEALKMRRSAPLRVALAAPALLFLLQILTMFAHPKIQLTDPALVWRELFSFGWIMWLGLFTPALIALEAICLINVEHSGKHWKQLFALPIPRWSIFISKMVFCGVLVALSYTVFLATMTGGILAFSAIRGLNLSSAVPWGEILWPAVRAYMASGLLIVVHTWISARFPGVATTAGISFAGILVGVLLLDLDPNVFGWWYPWTLPINANPAGLYVALHPLRPALFGAIAAIVLAPLASLDLCSQMERL